MHPPSALSWYTVLAVALTSKFLVLPMTSQVIKISHAHATLQLVFFFWQMV